MAPPPPPPPPILANNPDGPNSTARWYLRQEDDGSSELTSCVQPAPNIRTFQGRIPGINIENGHYHAALGIKPPTNGTVESIFVEYDYPDNRTRMIVSHEELQEHWNRSKNPGIVRVLLHQQVAIESGKEFNLTIKVKGTKDHEGVKIGFVYFELCALPEHAGDYTLDLATHPKATNASKIEKIALSDDKCVLAILSSSLQKPPQSQDCQLRLHIFKFLNGGLFQVDKVVEAEVKTSVPASLLAPASSSMHPQVVISHDGSRVVQYCVPRSRRNLPHGPYFQIYYADTMGVFGPASDLQLQDLPDRFCGHGRFVRMQGEDSNLTEYFLVSDGTVVFLYEQLGNSWVRRHQHLLDIKVQDESPKQTILKRVSTFFSKSASAYSLPLHQLQPVPGDQGPGEDPYAAEGNHESEEIHENLMASAWTVVKSACPRGYVAWSKGAGAVVVFDLLKGRFLMRAPRGERLLHGVRFSADGSLSLLSFEDSVVLYQTQGGRRIGEHKQETTSGWGAEFLHNDTQILSGGGFILDVRTMKPLGTYFQSRASPDLDYSPIGKDKSQALTAHGSKLDWVDLKSIVVSSVSSPTTVCKKQCIGKHSRPETLTPGTEYDLYPGAKYRINLDGTGYLNVTISLIRDDLPDVVVLRINPTTSKRSPMSSTKLEAAYFLKHSSHLVIAWQASVQVWRLPHKVEGEWDLVLYGSFRGHSVTAMSSCCPREITLTTNIAALSDPKRKMARDVVWNLYNVLDKDTSTDFFRSLEDLSDIYKRADSLYKRAWIRYVGLHINEYPDPAHLEKSVMAHVCSSFEERNDFETIRGFLTDLLEYSPAPWIPRQDYTGDSNPLAILIKISEKQPRMVEVIELVIRYCVNRARSERNLEDMAPVFSCMNRLVADFPDIITEAMQNLAFVPIRDRQFVIDNHILTHAPAPWRFNRKKPLALWQKDVDPLLQIKFPPATRDPLNEKFTGKLFVASFSSLWPQNPVIWNDKDELEKTKMTESKEADKNAEPPTMLQILWRAIVLIVGPKTAKPVQYRDFKLVFYDNPAIEALIQYKWNKFGYLQWLIRFIIQLIFYVLILAATFGQVYSEDTDSLLGVFIAIIVMSGIFLFLEFLQMRENHRQYGRSPYNVLDLIVFFIAIAASANQIVNIKQHNIHGNKSALSFTVICVFLHMVSELRVNQSVCKYVTIVLRVIREIKVFFLVFAMGILAFSTGTLHLIHGCPSNGCVRQEPQEGSEGQANNTFPRNFWHATSSIYFVMGGRYEPLGYQLDKESWDVQIMMVIYFLFTVVIMLNVLIALINVAFYKGDDNWRLVWLENRLRYVESAEILSNQIPGLRESRDWFPSEILYTATQAQEDDYRKRHSLSPGVPPLASASPICAVGAPKGVDSVDLKVEKKIQELETRLGDIQALLQQLVVSQQQQQQQAPLQPQA